MLCCRLSCTQPIAFAMLADGGDSAHVTPGLGMADVVDVADAFPTLRAVIEAVTADLPDGEE